MTETRAFPLWSEIDTVLLDLDGTLLDLAFDNLLWQGEMPARYAARNSISIAEARAVLAPKFRAWRGKLEWYCIDFWSRELGMDVEALHREFADRIAWLPGAREFLLALRRAGKRAVLCTNSHPGTLAIKQRRTGVIDLLDAAFSSHQFGAPKEDQRFWAGLRAVEPFDPARTLFVDDSPPVLAAARVAGIAQLAMVTHPDSTREGHPYEEGDGRDFVRIRAVSELLP